MKQSIGKKFTLCFLFIILAMFIFLNTYGKNSIRNEIIQQKKTSLYSEAELICKKYASDYYVNDLSLHSLRRQLIAIDEYLGTRIWLVNADGTLLCDTRNSLEDDQKINVKTLDSSLLTNTNIENLSLPAYFDEPVLSVTSSVIVNYKVKAYVMMFLPNSSLTDDTILVTNVINICLLILGLVLIILFIYLYIITVYPLRKLKQAAIEYTGGNYDYKLNLKSHDEFHDLGNTIEYMASEMNNQEAYQKKFIANISHDFRSPLTSIKGYAEAMLDGTIPYENQDHYLEIILFEAERLNKLTSNLLSLNTFDNKGMLLDISIFNVNEIIKSTVASFEGTCIKKKIKVILEFSEKDMPVSADMGRIQQVLYNLLDNAIKFSHSNSSIKITTRERNDKIFIAVKDHGEGIPKESITKIWDRFYKSDPSRGKDKKGTGLGLSIVKEIINAHNENINVVSTEGAGTEFVFSLPMAND
ncbi:phosphate regulon sensor protein PhoR [Lachnospiraceae bacterium KM106-2]|nr:phosphate regulon sensor protein PhoR [Lachnospiraceae bacterium KM106-2]